VRIKQNKIKNFGCFEKTFITFYQEPVTGSEYRLYLIDHYFQIMSNRVQRINACHLEYRPNAIKLELRKRSVDYGAVGSIAVSNESRKVHIRGGEQFCNESFCNVVSPLSKCATVKSEQICE
jgi:hypothetical protein